MKHSLLLLLGAATARGSTPVPTTPAPPVVPCSNLCDRMDSSNAACFVGTHRVRGQSCTTTRDCVNGELSADQLEPYWIREDRYNTDRGLTCYNPTGVTDAGTCTQRFVWGQDCHTNDNCESRFCVPALYGRGKKTCAAYDSVPAGEPCPYNDPLGEDRVHSICHGKAHCYQADGTLPPGEGVAVCKDWDEEGRECYVLYNVDGVTIKGDTCDPYREDLVCIPFNTTERPAKNAISLDQLSIRGICKEKSEAGSRFSCAPYPGTNKRPFCQHDRYCNELIEIDSTTGELVDNSVCSYFSKTDEPCEKDENCKFGLGCNVINGQGICQRILDQEDGNIASRDIFCSVGFERNEQNQCVVDKTGQPCTTDTECTILTPDGSKLPSQMFCDTRIGACRNVVSYDCEDEFVDYMEFLFNYNKRGGRLLDRVQCTKDDYKTCFSVRGALKKMKVLGKDLNCCAYRKANDDNTCFKTQEDVVFMPEGKSGWYWAADLDDQEGDVCVDTGMSTATMVVLIVLFVFLGCVMAFILIKEYYWHPKYGQKVGDGSSSSKSSSSSSGEVQAEPVNDDFDGVFGAKSDKSDGKGAGEKGDMTTE